MKKSLLALLALTFTLQAFATASDADRTFSISDYFRPIKYSTIEREIQKSISKNISHVEVLSIHDSIGGTIAGVLGNALILLTYATFEGKEITMNITNLHGDKTELHCFFGSLTYGPSNFEHIVIHSCGSHHGDFDLNIALNAQALEVEKMF